MRDFKNIFYVNTGIGLEYNDSWLNYDQNKQTFR